MLNKVQLIGHVGQDPEIRETPQGTKVADLRLATSRYWRDGEGNRQEETEWHRVVFWGTTAETSPRCSPRGGWSTSKDGSRRAPGKTRQANTFAPR